MARETRNSAFKNNKLERLDFPKSIVWIRDDAFLGNPLKIVNFESEFVSIDETAFPVGIRMDVFKKTAGISYDRLARDTESLKGRIVYCSGKIVQIIEGKDKSIQMRVNITKDRYGYYDDTIFVFYTYDSGGRRFLENDIINIYGNVYGRVTYETVLGAKVTLPAINAKTIERGR